MESENNVRHAGRPQVIDRCQLIEAHKAGSSVTELSRSFSCSRQHVYRITSPYRVKVAAKIGQRVSSVTTDSNVISNINKDGQFVSFEKIAKLKTIMTDKDKKIAELEKKLADMKTDLAEYVNIESALMKKEREYTKKNDALIENNIKLTRNASYYENAYNELRIKARKAGVI